MNRRSFFIKLSSAVAGCYFALGVNLKSTSALAGESNEEKFKNLEYYEAKYEVAMLMSPEAYMQLLKDPPINLKEEKIDISKWHGESILDKLKNA